MARSHTDADGTGDVHSDSVDATDAIVSAVTLLLQDVCGASEVLAAARVAAKREVVGHVFVSFLHDHMRQRIALPPLLLREAEDSAAADLIGVDATAATLSMLRIVPDGSGDGACAGAGGSTSKQGTPAQLTARTTRRLGKAAAGDTAGDGGSTAERTHGRPQSQPAAPPRLAESCQRLHPAVEATRVTLLLACVMGDDALADAVLCDPQVVLSCVQVRCVSMLLRTVAGTWVCSQPRCHRRMYYPPQLRHWLCQQQQRRRRQRRSP